MTLTRDEALRRRALELEDRLDQGRQASRGLWFGQPSNTGMVSLRGMLDPEAAAVLKSAIDPLSTPCPSKDKHGRTVEPDPRTPATRRAERMARYRRLGQVPPGATSAASSEDGRP